MNTEIKFRGWSIEGKKWLYGGVLFFKDGTAIMPDGEENEKMITSPVDPKSIGRFTGFCDRDDVEIYEGDVILSNHNRLKSQIKFEEFKYSICDLEDPESIVGFSFGNSKMPFGLDCDGTTTNYLVLGNIYLNPELLSQLKTT